MRIYGARSFVHVFDSRVRCNYKLISSFPLLNASFRVRVTTPRDNSTLICRLAKFFEDNVKGVSRFFGEIVNFDYETDSIISCILVPEYAE